jgi:chromosomal replication initiation ATPase DnaA
VDRLQSIAQQLVAKEAILTDEFPFANARIMFLTSEPGHGKTHLVEAIINHIADHKPAMLGKMVLSRGKFTSDHMTSADEYGGASVVVIDDIFADCQSVQDLRPGDLIALVHFITMLYERRIFAIITSNFRLTGDDGGILGRVATVDKIPRVMSRFKQVLAASGEIVLPGKDFREELAKRLSGGTEFVL